MHDLSAQAALSKASIILRKGGVVQIKIEPEPENEYDSNAIAFFVTLRVNGKELGRL